MGIVEFPAWRYGPNGASCIVKSEAETPEGWVDHPSKIEGGAAPTSTGSTPTPPNQFANPGGVPAAQGVALNPGGSPLGEVVPGVGGTALTGATTGDTINQDVDVDGWPWTTDLHVSPPEKTANGHWKLKPGKSRPDPQPGFPKPTVDLDL